MIRHVVLLTWLPDTTGDQHRAVVAALTGLPDRISQIARYRLGTDLRLAEGNAHLSVIADFANVADYEAYRDHPDHVHVISTLIKPILAGRSAVQYEVGPGDG